VPGGSASVEGHAVAIRTAAALFSAHGFDTVDCHDIAAAAGLSREQLTAWFATKTDLMLPGLEAAEENAVTSLDARPIAEPARYALRRALYEPLEQLVAAMRQDPAIADVYARNPSIQLRHIERHQRWVQRLTPTTALRLQRRTPTIALEVKAKLVVETSLMCFRIAIEMALAEPEGPSAQTLFDALLDETRR
jgi:AcrR family transcriptional regulator